MSGLQQPTRLHDPQRRSMTMFVALLVGAVVAATALVHWYHAQYSEGVRGLVEQEACPALLASQLAMCTARCHTAENEFLLRFGDGPGRRQAVAAWQQSFTRMEQTLDMLLETELVPEERKRVENWRSAATRYSNWLLGIVGDVERGAIRTREAATAALRQRYPTPIRAVDEIGEMVARRVSGVRTHEAQIQQALTSLNRLANVRCLIALLTIGFVALWVRRHLAPAGPQREGSAAARPQPAAPQPRDERQLDARILVVDDGPENRKLLTVILERVGAQVEAAENGRQAIEAVQAAAKAAQRRDARAFDLVLMDIQMPVLDGLAATRELRADGHTLPILAITAALDASVRQNALSAGCDEVLGKPFHREQLLAEVSRHLARSRAAVAVKEV